MTRTNGKMNWDLAPYFPEFNGTEMVRFKEVLRRDINELLGEAEALDVLNRDNLDDWETLFLEGEDLWMRLGHLGSYVGCLTAADARNEAYLREESALSRTSAEASKIHIQFLRAVKETPDDIFEEFVQRDAFRDAGYFLNRLRREARYTMDASREALATDLGVDGIEAWGRLYDTLSGKLEFDMEYSDGRTERLPMSQRRSLMENSDRQVRKAAFDGGNAAWKSVEDVAGAALNAISGTRLTLNRYRDVSHFLEIARFQSAVSAKTINAMFEAIFSEIELSRRILRLKARTMKRDTIAWYDLAAPLPLSDHDELDWETCRNIVQNAFSKAYPGLGEFTGRIFEKNWIDWEPRAGKRPGGFCTGSKLINESRIFMTYNNTLAHEVGHAFHSYILREKRPFATEYPMTLAESASTFGEMILTEGVLENSDFSDVQKAQMLDMEIGHGAIYLTDIPVRYEFEKAIYEERSKGELSVSDFKDLMAETQRRVFGEVLEEGGEDPYFWASKLHFYITGVTFYNFPYTFGFLLSRGLFACFKEEGEEFLPRYEAFLRLTGSDTCENVANLSIQENLEAPDFWVAAIRSLEEPLGELEKLLPNLAHL